MPTLSSRPSSLLASLTLGTLCISALCLGSSGYAAPATPGKAHQLAVLKVGALARATVSDAALASSQPQAQVVTLKADYLYKRDVNMKVYDLDTFLKARIPNIQTLADQGARVMFWCKDGYAPTARLSDLLGQGGLIAVADADAPAGVRWSPAPYKNVVLGEDAIDRYLVWRTQSFPAKPQPWGLDTIYILPAQTASTQ
ncbi:hypothetical protein GCM10008955_15960 [Deinococcus malanensis]|uniref:Rhodanese domain-containing protein n=1 Tax=Deinococcus malanensis TaxID=1706855 RepID=A0ABQ2ES65_9DEIO|nr:hypothetical protein [Deinococcus malanensis]GGK23223.1 hypothetical protein GCM10008955_15960 [Deinococcus malanensis]